MLNAPALGQPHGRLQPMWRCACCAAVCTLPVLLARRCAASCLQFSNVQAHLLHSPQRWSSALVSSCACFTTTDALPHPPLAWRLPFATIPAAAITPAPGPSSDSPGLGLANCLELKPGFYNLHWEVTPPA